MIKNIIFDFGDIFINLDKQAVFRAIEDFEEKPELTSELNTLNHTYEVGAFSTETFIEKLNTIYPKANKTEMATIWNSMLLDFPDYRLEFLEEFTKKNEYRIFLLSNTNELHINHIIETMGADKYNRFKNCFEQFYLSYEIELRKPNANIYEFVLDKNNLKVEETLFVDDTKENTDVAEKLGINCWNLKPNIEDVININKKLEAC